MAIGLAETGAKVALVARNPEPLKNVVAEIEAAGGSAFAFPADVTSEASVNELQRAVSAQLGTVSILVNNAGMNLRKSLVEFTLAEWELVLRTNLTSAFIVCHAFVPQMRGHGYGRIINLTSMLAHIALPLRTAYCASKAGLLGMTKALALELAEEGITVNAISPGPFATEMNLPILNNPAANADFLAKIPVKKWGRPEDLGALAVYLCSPAAAYVTGTDFVIDGGWTAQ